MNIPGKFGFPLLGDQSISFVQDPIGFVNNQVKLYGPIFKTRIINKPFVFVTSQSGVREILEEKSDCFERNYEAFLAGLFEMNIAFVDGPAYTRIHELVKPGFSSDMLRKYREDISRITLQFLSELDSSAPFDLYQTMKQVITEICIFLFIGIERNDPVYLRTKELLIEHWHGLISIPLPIRVPLLFSSGYDKAMLAKEQLISLLRHRLAEPCELRRGVLSAVDVSMFESVDEAANNFLLFVTAVIPKAITSLLVSCCLQMYSPENKHILDASGDERYFDAVLKEVQRLFPPFLGGWRNVRANVVINGFEIPKDYGVVYMAYHVHRDPLIFPEADKFIPERWLCEETREAKLWTFGGGERTCLGKHLSQMIISECVVALRNNFVCEIVPGQNLTYKWLPVSRPVNGVMVAMKRYINIVDRPLITSEKVNSEKD
ncbi:cytochrome [Oopsacas minuta]|uniref:Cytochrome n=1 Tax=Oopsacas minuta TaxID=111878 RepID=A0AAV7K359_9METZ|nr:cytochrome [Oopsacas minuta]